MSSAAIFARHFKGQVMTSLLKEYENGRMAYSESVLIHPKLFLYYNVINRVISYWPSYGSEVCCSDPRQGCGPIQQNEDS